MNKGTNIAYIGMLAIADYSTVGDLIDEMAASINTALGVTPPNDFEQIVELNGYTYILLPLPDGTFSTEGCSAIGLSSLRSTLIEYMQYSIVFGYYTNGQFIAYWPKAYFKLPSYGATYGDLRMRPSDGCALMLDTTFMDYGIMAIGGCQSLTNKQLETGTVIQPVCFSIIADNGTPYAMAVQVAQSYCDVYYMLPAQTDACGQLYRLFPYPPSKVQIMDVGVMGLTNSKLKIICNFVDSVISQYFSGANMTTVGKWYKDGITINGTTYYGTLSATQSAILLIKKPTDNT